MSKTNGAGRLVADHQVANRQVADRQVADRQVADRQVANHQVANRLVAEFNATKSQIVDLKSCRPPSNCQPYKLPTPLGCSFLVTNMPLGVKFIEVKSG
jgi:hypothetical protein